MTDAEDREWSWRNTADRTWQRALYDIPGLFLQKMGDRMMATTVGAHIQGLPSDLEHRKEEILKGYTHLLYRSPVLRVLVAKGPEDADVLEYQSPASEEESMGDASKTMLVHESWGGGDPFEWLRQMEVPAETQGRGQLHVFNMPDESAWIL